MSTATYSGIDLFSGDLPSKEELFKLHDIVNSSGAKKMSFADQTAQAAQNGNKLEAGIGFAILGEDKASIENLEAAKDCVEKDMYLAWTYRKSQNYEKAIAHAEKAAKAIDSLEANLEIVAILRDWKEFEKAEKELAKHKELENVSASYHYEKARLLDAQGDYQSAIENYETAIELDPDHHRAMFFLAVACDLRGDEEAAMDYYKQLLTKKPVYVSALLNLAVLYEDREDYDHAMACISTVLKHHPDHPRATLFKKDIASSQTMVYDEEKEKRLGKKNKILEIPISDFELSVRSRNCLRKMNIHTLGDLARISENELLSYKNFGETSLKEIRAIMESKGLKLGSSVEDGKSDIDTDEFPDVEKEILTKPVTELELSVRARKAVERLGIRVIGELTRRTEAELLGCKNFGVTSLNEIKQALKKFGLELRKLS